MLIAKEQIRQIISDNSIDSVADVYALLKGCFKDILQEFMVAESNASLGYAKNQKRDFPLCPQADQFHQMLGMKADYMEAKSDTCWLFEGGGTDIILTNSINKSYQSADIKQRDTGLLN